MNANENLADSALGRESLMRRSRRWAQRLLSGPIVLFPIRHHSPACAFQLRKLIGQLQPRSIIIEGPPSSQRWIEHLVDQQCEPPIAMLMTYRESNDHDTARHSAFYPMCRYSPEWIAIRDGHAVGATVQFADLDFADKIRVQNRMLQQDAPSDGQHVTHRHHMGVLLSDDGSLRHSRLINQLVRRLGCRDFDELWDHLFESRVIDESVADFVGRLATYCDLSRRSFTTEELRRDASLAREGKMLGSIAREYTRLKKPTENGSIMVVTGGMHTVALADAIDANPDWADLPIPNAVELPPLDTSLTGSWLIRYGYPQLDALSGYASGMPSPGFYDVFWQTLISDASLESGISAGDDSVWGIAGLVTEIVRGLRDLPLPHAANVSDSIAAVTTLRSLAALRDHPIPTRGDLLDSLLNCIQKEPSAGNELLRSSIASVLAGSHVGTVPSSAGRPPILDDFDRSLKALRLPSAGDEAKQTRLELYRKPQHRRTSFFLHQLQVLSVNYATLEDGPDFVNRYRIDKLAEQWRALWTPNVEARMAESAALGESVAAAAANQLIRTALAQSKDDSDRDARAACLLLVHACRCGLHEHAAEMLRHANAMIAEDSRFESSAGAMTCLLQLHGAGEPLETHRLMQLPHAIKTSYHRAVFLIDSIHDVPDEQLENTLDGLLSIREWIVLQQQEIDDLEPLANPSKAEDQSTHHTIALDSDLFFQALQRLINSSEDVPRSEIAGAAAGLLYSAGIIDDQHVCQIVDRYLAAGVSDTSSTVGVLRGLMLVNREVFWQMRPLLNRVDAMLRGWDRERFQGSLPDLRLAFSQMTPKEIDCVADSVADLHRVDQIGTLIHPEITEEEMQLGIHLAGMLDDHLKQTGLRR